MEVATLRLNRFARLARIFFLPFGDDVEVGLHFEKTFEDERETPGRWFLEGQNLDVVVVEPQMPAMALQVRFTKVVVEKRVVLEPRELELERREIQNSLKNAESVLFAEEFDLNEIADLEDEALHFLMESRQCIRDLAVEEHNLFARRERREQAFERLLGIPVKLCE